MPEGSSMRSPGSWQGGSWVSALLVDVFLLATFVWSCSVFFLLLFWLFFEQDLLIHKRWMLWHWSRHTLPVSVRGAGLFFCCGFCCCGSVVFQVAFFSELVLYGRILLHFRTPKEGYSACICVIRSTSTTRCDDLAEATGAQDGKKKDMPECDLADAWKRTQFNVFSSGVCRSWAEFVHLLKLCHNGERVERVPTLWLEILTSFALAVETLTRFSIHTFWAGPNLRL